MTASVRPGGRRFTDRTDAGRQLGAALLPVVGPSVQPARRVVLLGLPRGGVVVAAEAAGALGAALDAYPVRKVRSPRNPELAMGAVTADGTVLLNERVVQSEELGPGTLQALVDEALEQVRADDRAYRGGRAPLDLHGTVAVLVDDGAATGATVRACVTAARAAGAARVVVALPVAPRETVAVLQREADAVVCLRTPMLFRAVGWAYEDFGEVSTGTAVALLAAHGGTAAG